MIHSVKGTLLYIKSSCAVIDMNGFRLQIYLPVNQLGKLSSPSSPVELFTHLVWKDTGPILFGFCSEDDTEIFEQLIAVSGVGPKTALNLMGHFSTEDLILAIQNEEVNLISKVPGLGKKTANRLIIDLKDKFSLSGSPKSLGTTTGNSLDLSMQDAVSALVNLGYSSVQANKMIQKVSSETSPPTELPELITAALKHS